MMMVRFQCFPNVCSSFLFVQCFGRYHTTVSFLHSQFFYSQWCDYPPLSSELQFHFSLRLQMTSLVLYSIILRANGVPMRCNVCVILMLVIFVSHVFWVGLEFVCQSVCLGFLFHMCFEWDWNLCANLFCGSGYWNLTKYSMRESDAVNILSLLWGRFCFSSVLCPLASFSPPAPVPS